MKKILTIYYSRDGENYWNGEIRTLAEGNTKIAAEYIQEAVGGDIFRVETEKDYPEKYLDCIEAAKKELREHARPQLRKWPEEALQQNLKRILLHRIFVSLPRMFPLKELNYL